MPDGNPPLRAGASQEAGGFRAVLRLFPFALESCTPVIFGQQASQSVMGIQMAFAYIGSTLMPPLAGALTHLTGMGFLPLFVLGLVAVLLILSEHVNRRLCARDRQTAA